MGLLDRHKGLGWNVFIWWSITRLEVGSTPTLRFFFSTKEQRKSSLELLIKEKPEWDLPFPDYYLQSSHLEP
jgi:hypothetical protein